MGILARLLGHVDEVDVEKLDEEFSAFLGDNEQIISAYKLFRDLFIFSNKRIILVDKQGITSKRKIYRCIPYRSIVYYTIETTGHFDLEAELKLWVGYNAEPIQVDFKNDKNIYQVQKTLADFVLG